MEEQIESTLPITVSESPQDLARLDFWFFARFLKTKNEASGKIEPFPQPENGYEYLAEPIAELCKPHVYQLFLHKGRQMIFTWEFCAWELWKINCCPDDQVCFGANVAHREDDAIPILDRTWFMYCHLPSWLKSPLASRNKTELYLSSNKMGVDNRPIPKSGIDAHPANPEVGRSRTYSFVRLEEMAFMPYVEEMLASIKPTVSKGETKLIGLSTGNGRANAFARIVEQPSPDKYTKILRIFRDRHPIYKTAEWKQKMIEELAAVYGSYDKAREVLAREYEGSLEGKEGLIYDAFNEDTHVCLPLDIPPDWGMGVYIDPHPVKPTAVFLVALSKNDELYGVDEIWRQDTAKAICEEMRAKWGGYFPQINTYRIDPHCDTENHLLSKEEAANVFEEFKKDIPYIQPAPGTPENRINAVRQRLAKNPATGKPRFMLFNTCQRTKWEMRHYSTKIDLNGQIKINKVDDDFVDAAGYAAVSPPQLSSPAVVEYKPVHYNTTYRKAGHRG